MDSDQAIHIQYSYGKVPSDVWWHSQGDGGTEIPICSLLPVTCTLYSHNTEPCTQPVLRKLSLQAMHYYALQTNIPESRLNNMDC